MLINTVYMDKRFEALSTFTNLKILHYVNHLTLRKCGGLGT